MEKRTEKTIIKELRNNNLAVFAGAGLSRGSGFVDWKGLLKDIADELDLDIEKESDLIAVAQYHYNKNGREIINEVIVEEFQRTAQKNENMKILSRLPISTYWTTNYDSIIEDTLEESGKIVDVKIKPNQMKYYKPNRDAVVYKMHGDKNFPQEVVLTRDDYERYNVDRSLFTTRLKGELISKTFLFIGFSFEDPNLEQILSKVRIDLLGDSPKNHYCFFRKVNPKDEKYKLDNGTYDEDKFKYDLIKQNLKVEDLNRYGIKSILVDEYCDITNILADIEKKFRINKLFISGSAEEYGNWKKSDAHLFLHDFSKSLVEKNYHIISGFGLGIGDFVINGVLDEVHKCSAKQINEHLTLRPFPQTAIGTYTLKQLWTDYRQDIIKDAGVVIFVFGNKKEQGKISRADGMWEEFNIAKSHGKFIIPIASTGYVAEEIMNEIINDIRYWYLKDSESILRNSMERNEIIKEVIKILGRITNARKY